MRACLCAVLYSGMAQAGNSAWGRGARVVAACRNRWQVSRMARAVRPSHVGASDLLQSFYAQAARTPKGDGGGLQNDAHCNHKPTVRTENENRDASRGRAAAPVLPSR